MKKIIYVVLALVLFSTAAMAINTDKYSYSVRATSLNGAYQQASNDVQVDVPYTKATLSLDIHQDKFSLQSFGSMTMQVDRYTRRSITLSRVTPTIMQREEYIMKYSQPATLTRTYKGVVTKNSITVYVIIYPTTKQTALFYEDPVDHTMMYGQVFDNTKITICQDTYCNKY